MEKNRCAVFTIVKNEKFFLPIWIRYYSRYFANEDIFVLDHDSTDGSTDNLQVNVVKVYRDLAFDHQWLVETVQAFQKELLEKYECVIFAESDELLYSTKTSLDKLISDFIADPNKRYLTCQAHEVIQNIQNEKPLIAGENILVDRNEWFRYGMYDKTLISKIPLSWSWGFHEIGYEKNYADDLFMVHLHRVDFETMLARHKERATKWNLKDDGLAGYHHKIGDREGVLNYFNNPCGSNAVIERIPTQHKLALDGI